MSTYQMTQASEEDRRRRRVNKPSCSAISEPYTTEGLTVGDETCTLSKFFSGYFLAVAMALTVLLIFLWFSWGRKKNRQQELAETIKLVIENLRKDGTISHL